MARARRGTGESGQGEEAGMPWAGRFEAAPDDALLAFTKSVAVDFQLWRDDLRGSRAHVGTLEAARILTSAEATELRDALTRVEDEMSTGVFEVREADEDIHMAVERRVSELAGAVGGKLQTARSRNDQVALDLRLFVLRESRVLASALLDLASALISQAEKAGDSLLPGYTHMQRAQPVLLAHHLAAHVWPLLRDVARLRDAGARANVSPLGAGALSGTSIPIDPAVAADELGFARTFENSMDAVSDRDFVAEHLFVMALAQVHMSRLAEEIVLWSGDEFSFVALPDEWSTGSSMMPQKKNPDVAELVRGRSGRAIGNLVNLLVVLKGLPLAYSRDLQEDKQPIFDSLELTTASARALAGLGSTMTFDSARLESAASGGFLAATDLAEELVIAGVPFRDAHRLVGGLVLELERQGRALADLTPEELTTLHPDLASLPSDRFTPSATVAVRSSSGGTAPSAVRDQLDEARSCIDELTEWAAAR